MIHYHLLMTKFFIVFVIRSFPSVDEQGGSIFVDAGTVSSLWVVRRFIDQSVMLLGSADLVVVELLILIDAFQLVFGLWIPTVKETVVVVSPAGT